MISTQFVYVSGDLQTARALGQFLIRPRWNHRGLHPDHLPNIPPHNQARLPHNHPLLGCHIPRHDNQRRDPAWRQFLFSFS